MHRFLFALMAWVALSSAAHADPAPTTVQKAAGQLDTWTIAGGKSAGWELGDRVRISRNGKVLAEAMVVSVGPATSAVLISGRASQPLRAGDSVEFVRRRKPLPADPPAGSGARPPSAGGGPAGSGGGAVTDWVEVGKVQGLIGEDWMTRNTRYCEVWARKQDMKYVRSIVDGLDASYDVNAQFMGVSPPVPMKFYFFPLENPAHTQPLFAARTSGKTRFAGLALSGLNTALINMGNWRTTSHYQPWQIEETCRHEMNHLFAFMVRSGDRKNTWGWLYEALAHTAENTVKPPSTRLNMESVKVYMRGYRAVDASFAALIADRNNDDLEQYRSYDTLLVSVVFFLQNKYGNDVIARVMRASQGKDIEDALTEVTGKGVAGVEAEWKEFYGVR